jgi:hypothetical protein
MIDHRYSFWKIFYQEVLLCLLLKSEPRSFRCLNRFDPSDFVAMFNIDPVTANRYRGSRRENQFSTVPYP